MSPSSSKPGKPRATDMASEAKKYYIPLIRAQYATRWPTYSILYPSPLATTSSVGRPSSLRPPAFYVRAGDPVDLTLGWAQSIRDTVHPSAFVPLVCAAHERRPGGDWETGVAGYEERLCRRSNLFATLSTPSQGGESHYPIPIAGGIYSPHVVVFRGPHDRQEPYHESRWAALPVISLPPARWPKLTANGTKYSFEEERDVVRNKIRAALRICLATGARHIAIGDFGLGNAYRNPAQEMADMWREAFLYDPDIRGHFREVCFIFEDPSQRTMDYILEHIAKQAGPGSSKGSKGKSKSSSRGASSSSSSSSAAAAAAAAAAASSQGGPADFDVFRHAFDEEEIMRVLAQPDPRYGLGMITS